MDTATLRFGFLLGMVGLIFALLWRDRENVERSGILFYRRTKNGLDLIDRVAKRFPRFWKVYSWGGVLAAAVSVPLIFYSIYELVLKVVRTGQPAEGAGVVYPSTGSTISQSAGAIGVPAEYWFISIGILMVVHELSHGVIARAQDFDINSVGVLVLGVIPGAFVEPKGSGLPGDDGGDEAKPHGAWDQGDWISRVKVLAAGSWANYLTAGLFLVLALGFTSATSNPAGIVYQAQDDFPAGEAGMTNGTLQAVGNQTVADISDIKAATEGLQSGDSLELVTTEGNFSVTATSKEGFDGGYLGLQFLSVDREYKDGLKSFSGFLSWFGGLLNIVAFLNLGIGMFNMFPAKPLDGGHILDAVIERFAGEEYTQYVNAWSGAVLLLLVGVIVYSIIGPF
ncbi:site-2 protease family protein [Candidatus Nanohalobium constans]|uniref:Metalloprotease n=1 Tax=Candidatus Nanohalobium constans TaxID=2565781 RepID=A0A5Q0UHK5_9ARCH|nr:site-2 protease family protein [Candidatus Nanohalobium constans]QGA80425.1 metalloprotease [Candidatus Nanohalobium constans]